MNNFSKFCYGVRALGVGVLTLVGTYAIAKEYGIIDAAKQGVNNIKNRKRNKEAMNIYYSECFKGDSN